jgi:peptidoglycan/LPS O-acetylase OafA/YrhL
MGIGVQVFFVVSGYCIAATVASARRRPSPGREFFTRRFRRIFPPYWAALVVLGAVVAVASVTGLGAELTRMEGGEQYVPPAGELTTLQWLGNLSLTETWRGHLIGGPELKLLGPSWTLCYEEQFYAVCGILLLVRPGRFFTGVGMVTAATLLLVVGAYLTGRGVPTGFFFDGRWLVFACGVFVHLHVTSPPGGRIWVIPVLIGAAAMAAGWFRYIHLGTHPDSSLRQQAFEWLSGACFALLLLALRRWDLRLARARALQPVAFCGRMCYSLYLIHWPVTLVVSIWLHHAGVRGVWPTLLITIPTATAASIFASWGFYRVVERRFLNPPRTGEAPPVSSSSDDAGEGASRKRLLASPA